MACKLDGQLEKVVQQSIAYQLGPLLLSGEELSEATNTILSEEMLNATGDWTDPTTDISETNEFSFIEINAENEGFDSPVTVPKIEISKTIGTAWIRGADGRKNYVIKNPLSFIPASSRSSFVNWAMNTIVGSKASKLSNKELAGINKAESITKLKSELVNMAGVLETEEQKTFFMEILKDKNLGILYDAAFDLMGKFATQRKDTEDLSEDIENAADFDTHSGVSSGYDDAATIDPFKRVSDKLKLEFARIPIFTGDLTKDGKQIPAAHPFFPAIQEYMNPIEIHNILLATLADTGEYIKQGDGTEPDLHVTAYEHMKEKLEHIAFRYPGFQTFIDRLDASKELQAMLVSSYSLSLMDYVAMFQNEITDEDGNISVEYRVEQTGMKTSKATQLLNQWRTGWQNSVTTIESDSLTPKPDKLRKIVSKFDKAYKKYENGKGFSVKKFRDIMGDLGVFISEKAAYEIFEDADTYNPIEDLDLIFDQIKKSLSGFGTKSKNMVPIVHEDKVFDLIGAMGDIMANYAEIEAKYQPNIIASSVKGKGNKDYYKFAPITAFHKIIAKLKTGDRSGLEKLKEHPMYRGSLWIKSLTDPDKSTEELLRMAKNIEPFIFNLARSKNGTAMDNKDLTVTDQIILQMNMATAGFKEGHKSGFFTPTAADKPRLIGFKGAPMIGKIKKNQLTFKTGKKFVKFDSKTDLFTVNPKGYETINQDIVDQFVEYYNAEVGRISFEKKRFANHVMAVGQEVLRLEKESQVEFSDEQFYDEFNRLMTEFDTGFDLISHYHYNEYERGKSGIYMNDFEINAGNIRDTIVTDNRTLIKGAMTGKAATLTMFQEIPGKDGADPTETDIRKHIQGLLAQRYSDTLNNLAEREIITVDGTDKSYILNSDFLEHENIDQGIQFWLFNTMVQNIEFNKMFTGDLALYADAIDYFKRVPAVITDGQYMAARDNSEYETYYYGATIQDIRSSSKYLENIAKALSNEENPDEDQSWLVKGYTKNNVGDGQAFITPNRWRFIMERLNKWDKVTEAYFDKMVNAPHTITKDEYANILYLMQPIKGVASGLNTEGDTPRQIYNKYSQAIIIPAFANGTEMEKILAKMDPAYNIDTGTYDTEFNYKASDTRDGNTGSFHDNTVHEVMFQSAVKVGGANITGIHSFSEDGSGYSVSNDLVLRGTKLKNSDWKLQQDLPTKGIHATLIGSQIQNNIKAGLKPKKIYKIPGFGKLSGEDLSRLIDDVFSTLSNRSHGKLRQKLGMDSKGNMQDEGSFVQALLDEVRDKAGSHEKEALESGFSPNALQSIAGSGVTILLSMVTKAAVKLKANGATHIQISGSFTKINPDSNLRSEILFFDERYRDPKFMELNPPLKMRNGEVKRGRALMSYSKISEIFPPLKNEKFLDYQTRFLADIKSGKIDPEIFNVSIGYRIPNQNQSSNDSLEIIGILPPSMGDGIVLYDEIVTKTGSDFDIDKMFIMMNKPIALRKKGNQVIYENLGNLGIHNKKDFIEYVKSNYEVISLIEAGTLPEEAKEKLKDAKFITDYFESITEDTPWRTVAITVLGDAFDQGLASEEFNQMMTEVGAIDKWVVPNMLRNFTFPDYNLNEAGNEVESKSTGYVKPDKMVDNIHDVVLDNDNSYNFRWISMDGKKVFEMHVEHTEDGLIFSAKELGPGGTSREIKGGRRALAPQALFLDINDAAEELILEGKVPDDSRATALDMVMTNIGNSDLSTEVDIDLIIEQTHDGASMNQNVDKAFITAQSTTALENALVTLYRTLLEDPSTYHDVISPLDFDWLKDTINALGLNPKPDLAENLLFTDPIYQAEVKAAYKMGKQGISLAATHVVHHPLAQEAGLRLNYPLSILHGDRDTADGNKVGLWTLDRDWEVNMNPNGKSEDYKEFPGLDQNKLKITQSLSTFLNAYVDIAKDPYVTSGNFNMSTFNTAATLIRGGIQKEVVTALIASGPVIEFVKSKDKNILGPNTEIDSDDEIEEFDFNEFTGQGEDGEGLTTLSENLIWDDAGDVYLTPEQMLIFARDGELTGENALRYGTKTPLDMDAVKESMLHTYQYANTISAELGTLMKALKTSSGIGITIAEVTQKSNLWAGLMLKKDPMFDKASMERFLYRDGFKTAAATYLDNTVHFTNKLAPIFIQFEKYFGRFLNDFTVELTGDDIRPSSLDVAMRGEKEAMSSLYFHKDFGLKNKEYMEELFSPGKDGLGAMVLQAQREDKNNSNMFLANLTLDVKDPDHTFIEFAQISDNDPHLIDKMQDHFKELETTHPELYKRLVEYQLYAHGMRMAFGSYEKYTPTDVAYEKKHDVAFANARGALEDRLNGDTIHEIMMNNSDTMAQYVMPERAVDDVDSFPVRTSIYNAVKSKDGRKFLTYLQKVGFDFSTKKGLRKINKVLPGNDIAFDSVKPKEYKSKKGKSRMVAQTAYINRGSFPPLAIYNAKFTKKATLIKHRKKDGSYHYYKKAGSFQTDEGYLQDVYVLLEGRGYKSESGKRILEYNTKRTKIKSNFLKNYSSKGVTNRVELGNNANLLFAASKSALGFENKAEVKKLKKKCKI